MNDTTEEDYRFLPVEEAVHPAGGTYFQHYVNAWWAVHPDKGLAFYNPRKHNGRRGYRSLGAPQCNTDERISRMIAELKCPWPAEVRLIESVWVPINLSDYTN